MRCPEWPYLPAPQYPMVHWSDMGSDTRTGARHDQANWLICDDARGDSGRWRRRPATPDAGCAREQGDPEVRGLDVRAAVAGAGTAEVVAGARDHQTPARRSAAAYRVHQQDRGPGRQQDVRMRDGPVRGCAAALSLVLSLAAGASAQQAPSLEPKAIDVLKASSRRLAAARTMSFTAVSSYESPSRPGPPLLYTTRSTVILQRPDKLRVVTPGDGPASEFYYNGKIMVAFSPAENLVAVAEAPPTIDAALEAAYHTAAIYFPFTDAMVADPYGDIAKNLELAFYIGQSHVIGGTKTDMVAYASHGVFVQIWI